MLNTKKSLESFGNRVEYLTATHNVHYIPLSKGFSSCNTPRTTPSAATLAKSPAELASPSFTPQKAAFSPSLRH